MAQNLLLLSWLQPYLVFFPPSAGLEEGRRASDLRPRMPLPYRKKNPAPLPSSYPPPGARNQPTSTIRRKRARALGWRRPARISLGSSLSLSFYAATLFVTPPALWRALFTIYLPPIAYSLVWWKYYIRWNSFLISLSVYSPEEEEEGGGDWRRATSERCGTSSSSSPNDLIATQRLRANSHTRRDGVIRRREERNCSTPRVDPRSFFFFISPLIAFDGQLNRGGVNAHTLY